MIRLTIIIVFTSMFLSVQAQEVETQFYRNEATNERYDAGSPFISGIITPSYTPEMEFNITGGLLLSFKTRRNNPYLSHSVLPVIISISPDGDFSGRGEFSTYWFDNRLKIVLPLSFDNRDDHCWGVGIDAAESVTKGKNTTAFHLKSFRTKPAFYYGINNRIDVGLTVDMRTSIATDLSDLLKESPDIINDGTSIMVSGAGFAIRYNSRNSDTRPQQGIYIAAEGIYYKENLGRGNHFGFTALDYRQYQPIIRTGSLLAWNITTNIGIGNVPWTELTCLGSTPNQRGYFVGQYRDQSSAYATIEYRHTFNNPASSKLSRHGIVFWIGGGTVFEKISSLEKGIINTGIGYRYQLMPDINIRLDIGFSTDYIGIYPGFCEAF